MGDKKGDEMLLTTQIEIGAPPEVVRAKFLDFSKIPSYSPNGFFKSLGPATPGTVLEPGVKMHNVLQGMTIEPIILKNEPSIFTWRGTFLSLFNGEHSFRFLPSSTTPGHTTFIHEEVFSGPLKGIIGKGFLGRWAGMREKTEKGFVGFNEDFRVCCEGGGN